MIRPTLKERQLKLREDAILEATMRLLAIKGFGAMTMDDVANDVGISKATLYQHFKSKEELAVQVILHAMKQSQAFFQSIDPTLPAIERLRKIVRWIIAKRFGNTGLDFSDAEATIKPLVKRHEACIYHDKMFSKQLLDLVEAAKAEGHILPQLSTPVLAQAFMSCMHDAAYFRLLREGKCTMEDLETTLIGMISGGAYISQPTSTPSADESEHS